MTIWIDAQLPPSIAQWISIEHEVDSLALRDIGLRDAEDEEIFMAARSANAIVMTKDSDFVLLLERFGPPPKVILLTCGNTSNENLRSILGSTLKTAIGMLEGGETIVGIG